MRKLANALLIGATSLCFDAPVLWAETVDPQVARQKINLSGRQRMLTQRMSAAACIAKTGLDNGARAAVAQAAHDDFVKALNGLRDGDADLGLPDETQMPVREALDQVSVIWNNMSPAVRQLAAGYGDSETLSQIMATNTELLRLSNEAVQQIVFAYGGSSIPADVAKAIDVAGRQRMLSQRMVKAGCFVFVGVGGEAVRQELEAAIALFDVSLADLANGNIAKGIAAAPTQAVADQLGVVAQLWGPFRAQLEAIASGEQASGDDLIALAQAGDTLLAQAHQAVLRYVEMAQNGV